MTTRFWRSPPYPGMRGDHHGRAEKEDVAVETRHAAFRRCVEAADLCGRQGFRRAAPAPSHRHENRHVSRPPGVQGEVRGLSRASVGPAGEGRAAGGTSGGRGHRSRGRPMFLLGVPLLIFPFAIYNIVEFMLPGFAWSMEVLRFQLPSGADCAITAGDAMVAGSILLLIIEMLKAA